MKVISEVSASIISTISGISRRPMPSWIFMKRKIIWSICSTTSRSSRWAETMGRYALSFSSALWMWIKFPFFSLSAHFIDDDVYFLVTEMPDQLTPETHFFRIAIIFRRQLDIEVDVPPFFGIVRPRPKQPHCDVRTKNSTRGFLDYLRFRLCDC